MSPRITLTFSRIVDERLNPVNYTAAQYIPSADNLDYGQLAAPNTATTG